MFLFSMSFLGFSQSGTLKGVILDDANNPIPNVNIKAQDKGTVTNENGFFILKIPADQEVTVLHLT